VHFDWLGGVLSGDGCQSFMVMGLSPIHESIYNNSRQVVHNFTLMWLYILVTWYSQGVSWHLTPPCS